MEEEFDPRSPGVQRTPVVEAHTPKVHVPSTPTPIEKRVPSKLIKNQISMIITDDILIFAEFCEIDGPKFNKTWPDLGELVLNPQAKEVLKSAIQALVIRIFMADFQSHADCQDKAGPPDCVLKLMIPEIDAIAFVYLFSLRDYQARGYTRPFSFIYLTGTRSKIHSWEVRLTNIFSRLSKQLKDVSQALFTSEMEQHHNTVQKTLNFITKVEKTVQQALKIDESHGYSDDYASIISDKTSQSHAVVKDLSHAYSLSFSSVEYVFKRSKDMKHDCLNSIERLETFMAQKHQSSKLKCQDHTTSNEICSPIIAKEASIDAEDLPTLSPTFSMPDQKDADVLGGDISKGLDESGMDISVLVKTTKVEQEDEADMPSTSTPSLDEGEQSHEAIEGNTIVEKSMEAIEAAAEEVAELSNPSNKKQEEEEPSTQPPPDIPKVMDGAMEPTLSSTDDESDRDADISHEDEAAPPSPSLTETMSQTNTEDDLHPKATSSLHATEEPNESSESSFEPINELRTAPGGILIIAPIIGHKGRKKLRKIDVLCECGERELHRRKLLLDNQETSTATVGLAPGAVSCSSSSSLSSHSKNRSCLQLPVDIFNRMYDFLADLSLSISLPHYVCEFPLLSPSHRMWLQEKKNTPDGEREEEEEDGVLGESSQQDYEDNEYTYDDEEEEEAEEEVEEARGDLCPIDLVRKGRDYLRASFSYIDRSGVYVLIGNYVVGGVGDLSGLCGELGGLCGATASSSVKPITLSTSSSSSSSSSSSPSPSHSTQALSPSLSPISFLCLTPFGSLLSAERSASILSPASMSLFLGPPSTPLYAAHTYRLLLRRKRAGGGQGVSSAETADILKTKSTMPIQQRPDQIIGHVGAGLGLVRHSLGAIFPPLIHALLSQELLIVSATNHASLCALVGALSILCICIVGGREVKKRRMGQSAFKLSDNRSTLRLPYRFVEFNCEVECGKKKSKDTSRGHCDNPVSIRDFFDRHLRWSIDAVCTSPARPQIYAIHVNEKNGRNGFVHNQSHFEELRDIAQTYEHVNVLDMDNGLFFTQTKNRTSTPSTVSLVATSSPQSSCECCVYVSMCDIVRSAYLLNMISREGRAGGGDAMALQAAGVKPRDVSLVYKVAWRLNCLTVKAKKEEVGHVKGHPIHVYYGGSLEPSKPTEPCPVHPNCKKGCAVIIDMSEPSEKKHRSKPNKVDCIIRTGAVKFNPKKTKTQPIDIHFME
ncbi:hypothetical protein ADUPG1_009239 [Aduncisulcus paluster]|uniref:UDENN FLCN/SMCR8-type domain-containing protein n=1 Tax=Aduncisulcus paluster TaxID=2918883 RepID=A0ABQ5KXS9_9EUKA|nr:hypothetical protein ADUPG1_009239 [Aduncisulcus paluster]